MVLRSVLKSFGVRPLSHEDSAEGWHGPRGACLLFLMSLFQSRHLLSAQRGQALCLTSSHVSSVIILREGHDRASFRRPRGAPLTWTAQLHAGSECVPERGAAWSCAAARPWSSLSLKNGNHSGGSKVASQCQLKSALSSLLLIHTRTHTHTRTHACTHARMQGAPAQRQVSGPR